MLRRPQGSTAERVGRHDPDVLASRTGRASWAGAGRGLASENVGVHVSGIAQVRWPPAAMIGGRIVLGRGGRKSLRETRASRQRVSPFADLRAMQGVVWLEPASTRGTRLRKVAAGHVRASVVRTGPALSARCPASAEKLTQSRVDSVHGSVGREPCGWVSRAEPCCRTGSPADVAHQHRSSRRRGRVPPLWPAWTAH